MPPVCSPHTASRTAASERKSSPASIASQCGSGRAFQRNDDGYIVWVGEGNSPRDGITENLWQAQLPGSASPYSGVAMNWGMPIILRDEANNAALQVPLGHALPDYKLSMTHNMAFRKLSAYVLLDGTLPHDAEALEGSPARLMIVYPRGGHSELTRSEG